MDVRSPHAGSLKAFHAALNDTVAVGAALFTLDTDAAAGAATAAPSAAAAAAAPAPAPAAAAPPPPSAASLPSAEQHARVPSIHFRYGAGRAAPAAAAAAAARSSGSSSSSSGSSSAAAFGSYAASLEALYPSKKGALPELSVSPSFGRPALSLNEESFIFSGGAYGYVPPPPEKPKGAKK